MLLQDTYHLTWQSSCIGKLILDHFTAFAILRYSTRSHKSLRFSWYSEKSDFGVVGPVDIRNLRRKTRFAVTHPRTSTPEGIAITSVADKLDSHQTSTQVIGSQGNSLKIKDSKKKKTILRPVTELSRLALDRHELKEDNLVRPVTELARLGMDRWLDSAVLMKGEEAKDWDTKLLV